MKKIGVILFLLTILLAVSVAANTNWFSWGNNGFQGAGVGVDDILWGSNYPQGNITMDNVTLAVTAEFPPIVADWNLDGENELFIFSGSSIALYNNELELLSTINIGAPLQGQGCIFNMDSDSDLELAIIADSSLKIYESTGIDFSLVKTIALDQVYHDVYCTVSFLGSEFVIAEANGDFLIIEPIAETTTKINNQIENLGSCRPVTIGFPSSSSNNFQNRGVYVDYDGDNNNEFVYIQEDDLQDETIVNVYDVINEEFDLINITATDAGAGQPPCQAMYISVANIGLSSGAKEIIVHEIRQSTFKVFLIAVLDILGTVQYTDTITVSPDETRGKYISHPAVADVDTDSLNEMCYIRSNEFLCYTSTFVLEYNFSFIAQNQSQGEYNFFSLGQYKSTDPDFLEIIHPTGLFEINQGASRLDGIMNFTDQFQDNLTMPMPVSIEQQASFTKDIILIDSSVVRIFTRKGTAAVCGNSICESGESILNCEVDCSEDLVTLTVRITQVVFNPSIANVWKNNTDVQLLVTVEDSGLAQVQARAQLYFGQSFEEDTNFTSLSPSGTTFVFNMKANHTTSSSTLRISARNDVTPNLEDIQLFGFTVALDGDSSGDSTSTFRNPFPVNITETETDQADNAIVQAFRDIPTGGLGFDLIWYIVMLVVGGAIFMGVSESTKNPAMALGGALIAEIFLLIMGTLLGFIPLGIVIVIVVIGIIVISMFLRKIFTGTSS